MATILAFRAGQARAESPVRPLPSTGAEIVIFPGIRYEYHAEPPPPPPEGRSTRKRDRLDIQD